VERLLRHPRPAALAALDALTALLGRVAGADRQRVDSDAAQLRTTVTQRTARLAADPVVTR